MTTPLNCWEGIQGLGLISLRTLARPKSFEIVEISNQAVTIFRHETGTTKTIPKDAFDFACKQLQTYGRVEVREIDDHFKRCSSYVAAILVKSSPNIHFTREKPVRLYLVNLTKDLLAVE